MTTNNLTYNANITINHGKIKRVVPMRYTVAEYEFGATRVYRVKYRTFGQPNANTVHPF